MKYVKLKIEPAMKKSYVSEFRPTLPRSSLEEALYFIRCSAMRRPNNYRYYVINKIGSDVVSHAAVVVDEDKTKTNSYSRWLQFVQRIGA